MSKAKKRTTATTAYYFRTSYGVEVPYRRKGRAVTMRWATGYSELRPEGGVTVACTMTKARRRAWREKKQALFYATQEEARLALDAARITAASESAEPQRSWYGWVVGRGLLLGGVLQTRSSYFASREQAKAWVAQCVKANKQAGRLVSWALTMPSPRKPEVL